jgi:hypothetical protein
MPSSVDGLGPEGSLVGQISTRLLCVDAAEVLAQRPALAAPGLDRSPAEGLAHHGRHRYVVAVAHR